MDCSPPGFSIHEIFQARIGASFHFLLQGNLPNPGIETLSPVSAALVGEFFTTATREAPIPSENKS